MNSIGNDGTKALKVTVFPGEDPGRAPFEEWLDENDSALRGGGYGPAMRGTHPPALCILTARAIECAGYAGTKRC